MTDESKLRESVNLQIRNVSEVHIGGTSEWSVHRTKCTLNVQQTKCILSSLICYLITVQVERYGSFEVMSSLLFGFAVHVAFTNITHSHFTSETHIMLNTVAEIVFTFLMIVVLICNAYTMIVLSLTYFYVNRYMADREYVMAIIYLKMYANYRYVCRESEQSIAPELIPTERTVYIHFQVFDFDFPSISLGIKLLCPHVSAPGSMRESHFILD